MPIDDERRFLVKNDAMSTRMYQGPQQSKPSRPEPDAMTDPVKDKLNELLQTLETSQETRQKALDECRERDKAREESRRVQREKLDNSYEKLQQSVQRMTEQSENLRRDEEERQIREAEKWQFFEAELQRLHQERTETRNVFLEHLKEREAYHKEIMSALRERSKK